jgi:hypothetical protein
VSEQIQNLIEKQQIPVSEQIQNLIENNKYQWHVTVDVLHSCGKHLSMTPSFPLEGAVIKLVLSSHLLLSKSKTSVKWVIMYTGVYVCDGIDFVSFYRHM